MISYLSAGKPNDPASVSHSGVISASSATITWGSPSSSVDFPITEYKITVQKGNGGTIIQQKRESALSTVISSLEVYTDYTVTVYSVINITGVQLLSNGKAYFIKTDEGGKKNNCILMAKICFCRVPECSQNQLSAVKTCTQERANLRTFSLKFLDFER